jgi:hypothetical protein
VDTDTKVFSDSLTRMVSCVVHEEEILGLPGHCRALPGKHCGYAGLKELVDTCRGSVLDHTHVKGVPEVQGGVLSPVSLGQTECLTGADWCL